MYKLGRRYATSLTFIKWDIYVYTKNETLNQFKVREYTLNTD